VDPDGSQHEFYHDDGRKVNGVSQRPPMPSVNTTKDNTFIRVLGPSDQYCYPSSGTQCFRVETPDGLVYSLAKRVDCPIPTDASSTPLTAQQLSDAHSYCGWYTTLIEDPSVGSRTMVTVDGTQRIGTPHPVHVKVSYDSRPGFEHAISRIEDSDERVAGFNNCEWEEGRNGAVDDPSNLQADIIAKCKTTPSNPANRHAVATYSVTLPSFGRNVGLVDATPPEPPPGDTSALKRAEYRFYYELSRVKRADPDSADYCNQFPPNVNLAGCSSWSVLRLVRLDYPDVTVVPGLPRTYSQYFGYFGQPPRRCTLSGNLCNASAECPGTETCEAGTAGDFGEVACRTLPIARIVGNACGYSGGAAQVTRYIYSHDFYRYIATFLSGGEPPKKAGCIPWSACQGTSSGTAGGVAPTGVTRGVVLKKLEMPSGTTVATWKYDRGAPTSFTNPSRVTVTDPYLNDTVYYYHSSQTADGFGEKPEDGMAPEWRDGLNSRIDYFEGLSTTGRLVRSELQGYDAERYQFDLNQRSKENIRVQNSTTEHMDDGAQHAVANRSDWDAEVGRWRLEVMSGFGVSAPRTTKTAWTRGSTTIYNPQPLMVEVSDGTRVLSRTDNQYDSSGRLTLSIERATLPGSIGTEPTLIVYPGDRITSYEYSLASGNIIGKTLSAGVGSPTYSIRYTYGPTAGTCQVAGECGGYLATKAFLNGLASPWKAIDRSRDGNTGLIFAARDTAGVATEYEYDRLGRVTEVRPSGEETTRVDYASLVETTVTQGDANGSDFVFARHRYDRLGRLVSTQKRLTEPGQYACQKREYDVLAKVVYETEWMWQAPGACTGTVNHASEKGTTFEYTDSLTGRADPFGRVRRTIPAEDDPAAGDKSVSTEYFGTSSRVVVNGLRGAGGTAFSATTTFYRDALGRLQWVDAPPGGADAEYTYDAMDRLIMVDLVDEISSPTKHQVRRFGFDGLGRQAWADNPENGTAVFQSYDALGNLLQMQDAAGNVTRFDYDFAGRPRHEYITPVGASERTTVENTYDELTSDWSLGKVTTLRSNNEDGVQALEERRLYNGPGGRLSEHVHLFANDQGSFEEHTSYLYNARGQVSQITYPGETGASRSILTVGYAYLNGLPVAAIEGGTGTVLGTLSYNAAGGVKRVETPGGGRTEIEFDSRNRPTRIRAGQWSGATWLRPTDYDSGAYVYDGAGNIYEIGDNRYGYDGNGRLVSAFTKYDAATSYDEAFAYDVYGNISHRQLTTITNVMTDESEDFLYSDTVPRTNQILSRQTTFGSTLTPNPVAFAYDANGNLLVGGRRWQPTPNLPALEDIKRYDYDAQNRVIRIYKASSEGAGATLTEIGRYVYDLGGNRISKVEAGSGLATYYVRDSSGQVLSEFRRPSGGTQTPEWASDYVYLGGRLLAMKENLRPESPRGLRGQSAPSGSGHRVTLTWDENTDPDRAGYKVYRKREGIDSAFSIIAQPVVGGSPTISVLDTTVHATNQVLYYYVTAVDGIAYESNASTTIKVVAGDATRPSAPALQALAGDGEVTLTWTGSTDNSDIIGYEVWRGTTPSADVDTIAPLTVLTSGLVPGGQFVDGSVVNGTVYYYRVRGIDAAGNGGFYSCRAGGNPCDESAAPHDLMPPAPPTTVRAASTCGSLNQPETIDLSWDLNPPRGAYAIRYDVYRNTTPVFDGLAPVQRTTNPAFRDPASLTPGVTYFYALRAIHVIASTNPEQVVTTSALSQIVAGTARDSSLTPQVNLFAQATEGRVELSWQSDPFLPNPTFTPTKVFIYRRPNANRACGAYLRVGEMTGTWQASYPDATPPNNVAYDYAISIQYNGRESSLSRPTLAIPLARPRNVFQCYKANLYLQTGNQNVLQWTPPDAAIYQPLMVTPDDSTLGYLKGYHLYHHKRCNTRGTYGDFKDNSPLREMVVNASDAVDPYLIRKDASNDYEFMDPRYGVGLHTSFSPALDPDIISSMPSWDCGGANDNVNCVMPRAVYKVYAEGTWLTVESAWPDYFRAFEMNPWTRCDKPYLNPYDDDLPWCNDPTEYTDFVPTPRRVTAEAAGPGEVWLSWDPPNIPAGRPPVAGYYVYARDGASSIAGGKSALRPPMPMALVGPGERSFTIGGLTHGSGAQIGTGKSYAFRVATLDQAGRISAEAFRCESSGVQCGGAITCSARLCSNTLGACTMDADCSYGTCTASNLACSSTWTCPAGACSNTPSTGCTPVRRIPWTGLSRSTTSSSLQLSVSPAPINGRTLVAVIGTRGPTTNSQNNIQAVTQTGASWTRVTRQTNSAGVTIEVWYANNVSGAGSNVTITLAAPNKVSAMIAQYSGFYTGSAVDRTKVGDGTSVSPSTGQTANTSYDSEFWIAGMASIGPRTYSNVSNSFTDLGQSYSSTTPDGTDVGTIMLERIATSRASAEVGATLDASAAWAAAIATFRAAVNAETVQCNGGTCTPQSCDRDVCVVEGCEESSGRSCKNAPEIACTVSSDCPDYYSGTCNVTTTTVCNPALTGQCPAGQECVGGDVCTNDPLWVAASLAPEIAQPAPPSSLRTVIWTVNDDIVQRGRDGIKMAWDPGRRGSAASTVLGFRVYRSETGMAPFCALLGDGPRVTALPENVGPCTSAVPGRTVAQDASSAEYSTLYNSTSGAIHSYWDRTVKSEKPYYYRVTQLESDSGAIAETPLYQTEITSGRNLAYDENTLPPPQGFKAWAPHTGDIADRRGIALAWCAVPSSIDVPNSDLPALAYYEVYRTGHAQAPYRLLAKIAPSCLEPGNRCEITDAAACIATDDHTLRPGCLPIAPTGQACGASGGKRCGVVDLTFQSRMGELCWPAIYDSESWQMQFTYRYHVTAVAAIPGSASTESMPSLEDHGWLNYCANVYTDYYGNRIIQRCVAASVCAERRDPDGQGDALVCGNENASLPSPNPESPVCGGIPEVEDGPEPSALACQAGYRIIGQPTCLDCGGGGESGPPPNPYSPPARFIFYHLDHLGSPRVTLNSAGARVAVHHYLPFGEERPVQSDPTLNDRAFTGHQRDSETGLDYMVARYYSSSLGRFMSPDPASESINVENPQSWNRYAYVMNNPLRFIDPRGEEATATVNEEKKTITVTVQIDIYGEEASDELAGQMESQIEGAWNGQTYTDPETGTEYAVEVDAQVRNVGTDGDAATAPNRIEITSDVKDGRSWVNTFGKVDTGKWTPDAGGTTYAHEAGHLMGLRDDYKDRGGRSVARPGHDGHMMATNPGRVDSHEIRDAVRPSVRQHNSQGAETSTHRVH